jgi:hypothetical protein
MDRRKLLVGGIGVLVPATAGCLESLSANLSSESETEDETPQLPDGMTIETVGIKGRAIKDARAPSETVVSDEAAANEKLAVDDHNYVEKYINETDFSSSYLVAIYSAKSPGERFQVNSIQRKETGLIINYSATSEPDEAVSDVSVTSSFLIRITNDNGAVADNVTTRFSS